MRAPMVRGKTLCGLTAAISLLVATFGSASALAAGPLRIHVLSNRADMISGGDALVAVDLPRGAKPARVRVTVDGRGVTKRFATRADRHFEGLLTGLRVGRNVIRARLGKRVAK